MDDREEHQQQVVEPPAGGADMCLAAEAVEDNVDDDEDELVSRGASTKKDNAAKQEARRRNDDDQWGGEGPPAADHLEADEVVVGNLPHNHVRSVVDSGDDESSNGDEDEESSNGDEDEEDPGQTHDLETSTTCYSVQDAALELMFRAWMGGGATAGGAGPAFFLSLHVVDELPPLPTLTTRPIELPSDLVVDIHIDFEDDDDDDGIQQQVEWYHRSEWFRRFVTLLLAAPGTSTAPGPEPVGELLLEGFDFERVDAYRRDDVALLFGEVFRSYPPLTKLKFERCNVPATYLELMAASFTASSLSSSSSSSPPAAVSRLRDLELSSCEITSDGISHLAAMIKATDCRLRGLVLYPKGEDGLVQDDCRRICDAVCHNQFLRKLTLHVKEVRRDTLGRVAESSQHSSLRGLHIVTSAFTVDGFDSLTRQLRTNTRMHHVNLRETGVRRQSSTRSYFGRQMEETFNTYNFTLHQVHVIYADSANNEDRWDDSPNRKRIRTAVWRWESKGYRVVPTSTWPMAFATVSNFPTLLYRLLRMGNVDALCDVIRNSLDRKEGKRCLT